MCGVYCVYKQSRSCQLSFCARFFRLLVSSLFVVSNVIASRGFSIACSHCSLLWCENGIVYQQVIRTFMSYH